jgi:hypothetical protein
MRLALLIVLALPAAVAAQTPTPARVADEVLIRTAVHPLPEELRESATVLRWTARWETAPLRPGTGPMICLADNPFVDGYHAACYHRDMEPYMARGRALRAAGTTARSAVDSIRYAEVQSGAIPMPMMATLWQVTGDSTSVDWATGEITGPVRPLYVVYIPGATSKSTGLPLMGAQGTPWLMSPGTPSAHIMFVPSM